MSDIQRTSGPSRLPPTLEHTVRFHEAPASIGGHARPRKEKLTARPQSWFGGVRSKIEQAPITLGPKLEAPTKAPTPTPLAQGRQGADRNTQSIRVDDETFNQLAFKLGPKDRPSTHFGVGRLLTDEYQKWADGLVNNISALITMNTSLVKKNLELKASLKDANKSRRDMEKRVARLDKRTHHGILKIEQFYDDQISHSTKIAEHLHRSKATAVESVRVADEGLDLIALFNRRLVLDLSSDDDASMGEASSTHGTFGDHAID